VQFGVAAGPESSLADVGDGDGGVGWLAGDETTMAWALVSCFIGWLIDWRPFHTHNNQQQ